MRSGDPGNLSAEFVNSLPFAHQDAERVPQFTRRLRGQLRSPRLALNGAPGRLSVVTALRRQVISVATSLLSLVPLASFLGSGLSILDPAWLLWDPKRQCLHDKVADTVVVLRSSER